LEIKIISLAMAYVRIPPHDQSGCLVTGNSISSGGNLERFNIIAEISVLNTGTEIFTPPTSFVGTADCLKTAVYDFYQLDFPGGPYSRHATCLTDDSYYASAKQNGAPTCSESLTKSGIKQGGGYGVLRKVTVKFPMSAKQFMALNGTGSGTAVTVKLSVNPSITDGSPDTITLLNVTDKLGNIVWKKDGIFHSAIKIYTAPDPTMQPTDTPWFCTVQCLFSFCILYSVSPLLPPPHYACDSGRSSLPHSGYVRTRRPSQSSSTSAQ
jgi:hypothetical protein